MTQAKRVIKNSIFYHFWSVLSAGLPDEKKVVVHTKTSFTLSDFLRTIGLGIQTRNI